MSKKLKLFGLLALTVALGAGVAWAFAPVILNGNSSGSLVIANAAGDNVITGNGTQMHNVDGNADLQAVRLRALKGNTVTLAPANTTALANQHFQQNGANNVQVLVNDTMDEPGTVVIKASNGDAPDAAGNMTNYLGGTVLYGGTLGVTHNNALGLRWVGAVANPVLANSPVFRVQDVDVLQLGVNAPDATPTIQPFFMFIDNATVADQDRLTYVTFEAPNVSDNLQGLRLHHGLAQRTDSAFADNGGAADTPVAPAALVGNGGFARLIKTGKGMMWINGDTAALNANEAASTAAVDGAYHRGGTVVREGTLQMDGGNASVANDHFRGALGRIWNSHSNVALTPANPYNARHYFANVRAGGALYNPLSIEGDARVIVNRSQFFSDFNVASGAVFHSNSYTLAGTNYNPQIAVTLDRKDSKVEGLLEGNLDLVVFSTNPAVTDRPNNDPQDPALSAATSTNGQAVLYLNNAENKIYDKGETLVAEGVLEIAGAKSIGGGKVTVGAEGAADRGFTTTTLGTFASSKTFKLENESFTKSARAGLAVERGETLSFKDITMDGTLTINPIDATALALTHNVATKTALMPKNWSGTVEFGAASSSDAVYRAVGVMRRPTNVFVDRGVWQLNSFPTPTAAQVTNGENPFMDVTLVEGATLSLGKDVNDFRPYMDLTINNDSRIRLVLRDSDIAATRADAMGKAPVFAAREINYGAIGYGEANRDRRLAIQLDPSQLTGSTIKKGWIKLIFSDNAVDWNAMHFLRENSNVNYEDYAKVRITWTTTSDIVKNAVARLDENSYTILVEVGENVTDPVNPSKPTPPAEDKLTATLTPSATSVAPGAEVTVTLGDWTYKGASADVVSEDVTVTGGTIKTPLAGKKVVLTAGAEGTMTVTATSVLKSDATVKGTATTSITVTKGGGSGKKSDSSGGCDAGFGALALVAGAAFLLRRKN